LNSPSKTQNNLTGIHHQKLKMLKFLSVFKWSWVHKLHTVPVDSLRRFRRFEISEKAAAVAAETESKEVHECDTLAINFVVDIGANMWTDRDYMTTRLPLEEYSSEELRGMLWRPLDQLELQRVVDCYKEVGQGDYLRLPKGSLPVSPNDFQEQLYKSLNLVLKWYVLYEERKFDQFPALRNSLTAVLGYSLFDTKFLYVFDKLRKILVTIFCGEEVSLIHPAIYESTVETEVSSDEWTRQKFCNLRLNQKHTKAFTVDSTVEELEFLEVVKKTVLENTCSFENFYADQYKQTSLVNVISDNDWEGYLKTSINNAFNHIKREFHNKRGKKIIYIPLNLSKTGASTTTCLDRTKEREYDRKLEWVLTVSTKLYVRSEDFLCKSGLWTFVHAYHHLLSSITSFLFVMML